MGFFIPKNPKVEHNFHTMVVHVRERGTPHCPLNQPMEFHPSGPKLGRFFEKTFEITCLKNMVVTMDS